MSRLVFDYFFVFLFAQFMESFSPLLQIVLQTNFLENKVHHFELE
jgi:hypothetical protein